MDTQSELNLPEIPPPFPAALSGRVLWGLFVTILPIVSFSMVHLLKPDWQSGNASDYAILFLFPEASLFVLPLLTYSIICYLLLLINVSRFAPLFLVRLGIYTGVLLALHYSVAVLISLEPSPWLLVITIIWLSPLIFSHVYPLALKKWNIEFLGVLFASFVAVLALASMIISRNLFSPFFTILVFLVIVAPFWSFLISARAAIWLLKHHESKVTFLHGFGFSLWIAAYAASLRYDILKMYELYAALPPTPPDCYIATAAAKGHSYFVRSQTVHLRNGGLMQVNSQLQHFKSVEIALMAISPKLHHLIRKIYDLLGKKLAAHIQKPLLADVAFLLLLPIEWVSFLLLKLFVPEIEVISKKIYHS
jgi:hypothetical protein